MKISDNVSTVKSGKGKHENAKRRNTEHKKMTLQIISARQLTNARSSAYKLLLP